MDNFRDHLEKPTPADESVTQHGEVDMMVTPDEERSHHDDSDHDDQEADEASDEDAGHFGG
ncbi:Uu.00g014170.m01.CDS01 [Anthostomella pinea]|uniref:Uu.00g014170.m01.CDS01 n=1 Tax=Anthostomella pinea TaxID=933095 RepID=A0AAI8VY93_9PEZI|nr:Uu.00g014170.m01.CDS01 [Anthostomella pinea]